MDMFSLAQEYCKIGCQGSAVWDAPAPTINEQSRCNHEYHFMSTARDGLSFTCSRRGFDDTQGAASYHTHSVFGCISRFALGTKI